MDAGAIDTSQLKSFSLTHFQYQAGDPIGMFLALISLFPIFFIVMETTIVLSRREVAGVLLLIGQLLNEAFNLVLKEVIQEDRPHFELGDGYGMPSSHSQFMGFFISYTALYLETKVTANAVHRRAVQLGALVLGILVVVSRVYLQYHTVPQVLAGSAIGLATGCAWYAVTEFVVYRSGAVEAVLNTQACKWLMIRDSRGVPDIARAEYNLSQGAQKSKRE
ncbi:dolichyldiphosphatase [Martensiomyces pterosporus]|nr:dolichyldiphosphatase [Martensiomyces pterosporus]